MHRSAIPGEDIRASTRRKSPRVNRGSGQVLVEGPLYGPRIMIGNHDPVIFEIYTGSMLFNIYKI
jgi:hypothetical protein